MGYRVCEKGQIVDGYIIERDKKNNNVIIFMYSTNGKKIVLSDELKWPETGNLFKSIQQILEKARNLLPNKKVFWLSSEFFENLPY